jgi:hypothetical protein
MASMLPTLSEQFDTASFKGNYAICCVPEGGHAQSASIGVLTFDGNGGVSGSAMTNLPGARFGERIQLDSSIEGTYSVDADGSGFGSLTATSTAADSVRQDLTAVLLISKAEIVGGAKIAQEASIMVDAVDPRTGGLSIILASRHPDEGEFSLASFSGTYGGPGWGRGGQTPASAIGIGAVHLDGNGNFTAVDVQNLPGATFSERRRLSQDTPNGRYTLDRDGRGMVSREGARAHFVVTKAKVSGNVRIVLEYFFITDDLIPPTANLVTTNVTKRLP